MWTGGAPSSSPARCEIGEARRHRLQRGALVCADRSPARRAPAASRRSRVSVVALPWWRARRPSKRLPLALDVGEGRLDLLGQPRAVEAEVGGSLARHLLGAEPRCSSRSAENRPPSTVIATCAISAVLPVGTSTKQPMTSGGSWAWISSRGALVSLRRRACASASAATRWSSTGRYQDPAASRKSSAQARCSVFSGCGMFAVGSARSASSRPARSIGSSQRSLAVLASAGGEHDLLGEALDRPGAAVSSRSR